MRWLVATVCALGCWLPDLARAYHDDPKKPQTVDSAYTLPNGMWRWGFGVLERGVDERVTVTTYHPLWTILTPNAGVKWRLTEVDRFTLAARLHLAYFSTRFLNARDADVDVADLFIVPVELLGSIKLDEDWTLDLGSVLTWVGVKGTFADAMFQGAAGTTNLQVHTTLEWRLSRLVKLLLHARYQVFQTTRASATVTVHPDDYTTATASAAAESDILDFPHAFQVVPAILLSWELFNLRLGVGYGNYNIPAVNFMLPERFVVPDVDFYFVF